jgi:hypothetical protein
MQAVNEYGGHYDNAKPRAVVGRTRLRGSDARGPRASPQYEEKFRANKIDGDLLGDLERLGLPLGDSKRLLSVLKPISSWQLKAPGRQGGTMDF